jgi:hypothetical protein
LLLLVAWGCGFSAGVFINYNFPIDGRFNRADFSVISAYAGIFQSGGEGGHVLSPPFFMLLVLGG